MVPGGFSLTSSCVPCFSLLVLRLFMHTHDPLSMTPSIFPTLTYTFYPCPDPPHDIFLRPRCLRCGFFLSLFFLLLGTLLASTLLFDSNPYIIFYYTNNIHYLLIHPTLQRHERVLLHSYAAHLLPTNLDLNLNPTQPNHISQFRSRI